MRRFLIIIFLVQTACSQARVVTELIVPQKCVCPQGYGLATKKRDYICTPVVVPVDLIPFSEKIIQDIDAEELKKQCLKDELKKAIDVP